MGKAGARCGTPGKQESGRSALGKHKRKQDLLVMLASCPLLNSLHLSRRKDHCSLLPRIPQQCPRWGAPNGWRGNKVTSRHHGAARSPSAVHWASQRTYPTLRSSAALPVHQGTRGSSTQLASIICSPPTPRRGGSARTVKSEPFQTLRYVRSFMRENRRRASTRTMTCDF